MHPILTGPELEVLDCRRRELITSVERSRIAGTTRVSAVLHFGDGTAPEPDRDQFRPAGGSAAGHYDVAVTRPWHAVRS